MDDIFINKRIQDQKEYIKKIQSSLISEDRKQEILKSANGQLKYFNNLNKK